MESALFQRTLVLLPSKGWWHVLYLLEAEQTCFSSHCWSITLVAHKQCLDYSVDREEHFFFLPQKNHSFKKAAPLPTGSCHGAAPTCFLSAWKTFLLPESQVSVSPATSGRFLAVRLHAGRRAVLSSVLWDLQGPRGAQVQPQLLPSLSAAVLEQEEGQAWVSCL